MLRDAQARFLEKKHRLTQKLAAVPFESVAGPRVRIGSKTRLATPHKEGRVYGSAEERNEALRDKMTRLQGVGAEHPGSDSPGPDTQDAFYRLMPDDCYIHGFTTLGTAAIAPDVTANITIGSGSCKCMTPKFMQFAAYEGNLVNSVANLIENCTPCPVMLENARVGIWPGRMSDARGAAWAGAALDETPMHCINFPSFSNVTYCQLILTFRNILDLNVHVIGKLYVICEGGCCSF